MPGCGHDCWPASIGPTHAPFHAAAAMPRTSVAVVGR